MELESYVQMLVFQEQKLIESTFSLMGHNTRSAQRGTFARLMAFQKLIRAQMLRVWAQDRNAELRAEHSCWFSRGGEKTGEINTERKSE